MARKTIIKLPLGFKLQWIEYQGLGWYSLTTSRKPKGRRRIYTTRRIGGLKEL